MPQVEISLSHSSEVFSVHKNSVRDKSEENMWDLCGSVTDKDGNNLSRFILNRFNDNR